MKTIKDVLAGLTCLGLFVAVSILAATPAHAQQGGRPGVAVGHPAAPSSAPVPPPRGRRLLGGGTYWYPGYDYGYGGYGYGGYDYSDGGFNPGFSDPYGVFGGSAPFQGVADPYGAFGGSTILDLLP